MDSVLAAIRPKIEKYINMICTLYDVDVDVCDASLIRIAGTGINDKRIGERLASGRISQKAMNEKSYVIAGSPMEEEICQGCINQDICINRCGMTFPIVYKEAAIGAINITALSKQQEDELIKQQEKFILFMQSVCDMITLTVKEYESYIIQANDLKLKQRLIDVINDGVMILDKDDNICFINKRCEKVLGYNLQQIIYLTKIRQLSLRTYRKSSGDFSSCRLTIRDTSLDLTGSFYDVDTAASEKMHTIFVFFDIRNTNEEIAPYVVFKKRSFDDLVGKSPVFIEMLEKCKKAAPTLSPVLLSGESGTGKSLIAHIIHSESPLYKNRFIDVLYRGSVLQYTDAENCTLYIRDIAAMDTEDQQALLQIISSNYKHNCRVICGSAMPLEQLSISGMICPELFYILDVNTVEIPALRERSADIRLLSENHIKYSNMYAKKDIRFSKDIYDRFLNYNWPGNIRELENTITYIVEHAEIDEGKLELEHLPSVISDKLSGQQNNDYDLKHAEKALIIKALNEFSDSTGGKVMAAKKLGISTATLYRKMEAYGIRKSPGYR